MPKKIRAILMAGLENEVFVELQAALELQGIATSTNESPLEALRQFQKRNEELLVFTNVTTPAGNWSDVLRLFEKAKIPVIVVSRTVDINVYIDAMEEGAADFIVPPFANAELSCVVHNALSRARASAGKADRATT